MRKRERRLRAAGEWNDHGWEQDPTSTERVLYVMPPVRDGGQWLVPVGIAGMSIRYLDAREARIMAEALRVAAGLAEDAPVPAAPAGPVFLTTATTLGVCPSCAGLGVISQPGNVRDGQPCGCPAGQRFREATEGAMNPPPGATEPTT